MQLHEGKELFCESFIIFLKKLINVVAFNGILCRFDKLVGFTLAWQQKRRLTFDENLFLPLNMSKTLINDLKKYPKCLTTRGLPLAKCLEIIKKF